MTNRPIGTSSGPPGAQQPTSQQDQPGPDQQGRQPVAADRPDRASADPYHDLEEHHQHQEGDQPGRDQPDATGGQVTPAAHHTHQPPTDPGTDQEHEGPGIGPGLEPVGGVLDPSTTPAMVTTPPTVASTSPNWPAEASPRPSRPRPGTITKTGQATRPTSRSTACPSRTTSPSRTSSPPSAASPLRHRRRASSLSMVPPLTGR